MTKPPPNASLRDRISYLSSLIRAWPLACGGPDYTNPETTADAIDEVLNARVPADPDRQLEVLSALLQCADAGAALEKMTDEQIGNLLIEHAWPHFDMLSPLSDLVSEAADRLKGDVKCQPCAGTGRVINQCERCRDSTDDHECETFVKCAACEGVGTVKAVRP